VLGRGRFGGNSGGGIALAPGVNFNLTLKQLIPGTKNIHTHIYIYIYTYKTSLWLMRAFRGVAGGLATWISLDSTGLTGTHLEPPGLTWTHLYSHDSFGLAWTQLGSFGLTWDSLGFTWTRLGSLGLTWTHLDSVGTHLDSLGPTWDSLGLTGSHWVPLGPTWTQLGSQGLPAIQQGFEVFHMGVAAICTGF